MGKSISNFVVFLCNVSMRATGGYLSPNGFYITVTPEGEASKTCEHSVSVWEVEHPDQVQKEKLFTELFGMSSKEAELIDINKGVFKKLIATVELPKRKSNGLVVSLNELAASNEEVYNMAIDNIAV
jgi:hypothetical protein